MDSQSQPIEDLASSYAYISDIDPYPTLGPKEGGTFFLAFPPGDTNTFTFRHLLSPLPPHFSTMSAADSGHLRTRDRATPSRRTLF